jgi:tetratricopeptide (TPR) repeat protein
MKAQELQEAIADFRESFALKRHAKTAELMGECLWKQQRLSEAESILEEAVAMGREARAPLILAEVLLAQKKRTEAKEMAMESLRRNPQYDPAIKFLSALSIEGA